MTRRGLTLLETAVSAALVALLTLGVLSVYPLSILALSRGGTTLQADQVAQTVLDDAQSKPFTGLQPGPAMELPVQTRAGFDYHPSLKVFTIPGTDPFLLKGLRVTVWWQERSSVRKTVHELWIQGLPR